MLTLKVIVITNALLSSLRSFVLTQQFSEGRFDTTCGLLLNNIYCFGGTVATKNGEVADQSINVLDITAYNGLDTVALETKWASISSDTNGVNLVVRTQPLGVALPDGENMILIGGNSTSFLQHAAIVFNAKSRQWVSYPNYREGIDDFTQRQIYAGTATYVPLKGVALFGGLEAFPRDASGSFRGNEYQRYEDANAPIRKVGFPQVTLFDVNSKSSPWFIPLKNDSMARFIHYQASVFDSKTNSLYYFGGTGFDYKGMRQYYNRLDHVDVFDLNTAAWTVHSLSGYYVPAPRVYHTTTMLPSGDHVMLYGGSSEIGNTFALSEYCFTLDLRTFVWTQHSIPNAPQTAKLARTRHSVVLADNTAFVIFGKDDTNTATNSVLTLDVSDPLNITYIEKHVNPNIPLFSSENRADQTSQNPTNREGIKSLETGAIVGIAIGAAVVGIVGILGIIFCLRRRKGSSETKEANEIEVNWDEMDKQYIEVIKNDPVRFTNLSEDTATANKPNSVVDRNLESNNAPMSKATGTSSKQLPNVVEDQKLVQRPDTSLVEKPDVIRKDATTFYHQIIKPDGGSS